MPLKKIGRAIKKTVRKVVPKELSGIMTAAAPFVAPFSLPAAAALSIGGQLRTGQGRINPILTGLSLLPGVRFQGGQGLGAFRPTGFTRFGDANFGSGISARELFFGGPGAGQSGKLGAFGDKVESALFGTPEKFAMGAEADGMISVADPKQGILGFGGDFGKGGSIISSMKDGSPVINKAKVVGLAGSGLSLTQINKQIDEDGEAAGLGPSELDFLKAEAADIFADFDTTAFRPQVTAAIGGLMRKNLREGSKGKPRPGEIFEDSGLDFPVIDSVKPNVGNKAEITAETMAQEYFGVSFNELTPTQQQGILELIGASKPQAQQGGLMRSNYALGTKPTAQESGLGGLPIEADMRYSGGFMPYGAKEKADDVPARLSKNEFVFTADAVRAAGGGDINMGARRMYNTMKQLESMGRA